MKKERLTIPTVTLALKAKKLLAKQGIKVEVINISESDASDGCRYGLEFSSSYYFSVVSILKDAEIPHRHFKRN